KVRTFDVLPKVFFSYDSIVGFLHLFFFTPTAPSDSYTLSLHDALPISKQRGFVYQYGAMIGELDYFTHEEHGVLDWFRDNKPAREKGYTTQLIGEDTVKYIDAQDPNKPFYLYLTFHAPHTPYQAPQEYIDR